MSKFLRQNKVTAWLQQIYDDALSYEEVFTENVISQDDIPKYYDIIISDYEKLLQDLMYAISEVGKEAFS